MRESRDKTERRSEPAAKQPADLTRPAVFVLKKEKKRNNNIFATALFNESVARVEG